MLENCTAFEACTIVIPDMWQARRYVCCVARSILKNHHTHPYRTGLGRAGLLRRCPCDYVMGDGNLCDGNPSPIILEDMSDSGGVGSVSNQEATLTHPSARDRQGRALGVADPSTRHYSRIVQYAAGVECGAVARCSVGVYLALRAFQDLNYYYDCSRRPRKASKDCCRR